MEILGPKLGSDKKKPNQLNIWKEWISSLANIRMKALHGVLQETYLSTELHVQIITLTSEGPPWRAAGGLPGQWASCSNYNLGQVYSKAACKGSWYFQGLLNHSFRKSMSSTKFPLYTTTQISSVKRKTKSESNYNMVWLCLSQIDFCVKIWSWSIFTIHKSDILL